MNLEHLSDVHTGRHTQRVQYDIKRTSIWKEWHVFYRKYTGNDTLVTMTTSHLISYLDLSLLCDVNTHGFIHSRRKFISVFSRKYFCIYDNTKFTMRNTQRRISYFTCFFTEDCAKKSFLGGQLGFSLWCYFSDKNIAGTNLCTDADDTLLIQIFERIIADTRHVAGNLFRSEFGISGFGFVFCNMNGSIYIFLYQSFTKKNGVLVVVTFPCHKSDQRILTKSDLSAGSRRSVCDNLSFFDHITFCHDWTLVHTSTLVASYKLRKFVFIAVSICLFDDDTVGLGAFYHTAFFRYDTVT